MLGLYVDGFEGAVPLAILLLVIFELGLFGFGVGLLELDELDGLLLDELDGLLELDELDGLLELVDLLTEELLAALLLLAPLEPPFLFFNFLYF